MGIINCLVPCKNFRKLVSVAFIARSFLLKNLTLSPRPLTRHFALIPPYLYLHSRRMRHRRISRTRRHARAIRLPALHRPLYLVVDLQDHALGAKLPALLFFFLPPHPEGVHDVVHVLPRDPVQVEVRRVQLAAQEKAPLLVPPERRPVIAAIPGERFEIPGGVGQFERARGDPLAYRNLTIPMTP